MKCPYCESVRLKVRNTDRLVQNVTKRRYRCEACDGLFTTHEQLAGAPPLPLKNGPGPQARRGVHPAVAHIADLVRPSNTSLQEIAARAGITAHSLSRWIRGGSTPGVHDLEAVLNVVGYTLTVERTIDLPTRTAHTGRAVRLDGVGACRSTQEVER